MCRSGAIRRYLLALLAVLLILAAAALRSSGVRRFSPSDKASARIDASLASAQPPLSLQYRYPPNSPSATGPELSTIANRFRITKGRNASIVIHALHAFRWTPALLDVQDGVSFERLNAVLLDQEVADAWYGGELAAVRTSDGFKFVTAKLAGAGRPAAQAHVDQVLALFAELGLSPSQRVLVRNGTASIADFLSESTASFRLSGEFEWSATIRARYFPHVPRWRNRFGESFDFETTVCALIVKPLEQSNCGGTHSLCALAIIAQADAAQNCLPADVRRLLNNYLRSLSTFIASGQEVDGSFDPFWYHTVANMAWYQELAKDCSVRLGSRIHDVRPLPPKTTVSGRPPRAMPQPTSRKVLVTGHHLEWILLRPLDDQPPPIAIHRALRFLHAALEEANEEEIAANYCPYSHALAILSGMQHEFLAPSRLPDGKSSFRGCADDRLFAFDG